MSRQFFIYHKNEAINSDKPSDDELPYLNVLVSYANVMNKVFIKAIRIIG